jgi:CDP-diacylglycerol--glycerol-3-phosphate 3-phosphatidyltransferase
MVTRKTLQLVILSVVVDPLAKILICCHIGPNLITVIGLLLTLGVAYLFSIGYFIAAGIGLLVASLFDVLDGAVARINKRETKLGSVLDSVSDRIGESALFLGLMIFNLNAGESLGVVSAFVAALLGFLVSYTRAKAEILGIPGTVGLVTRPERVILLTLGALLGLMTWFLVFIAVGSLITFLQRFVQIMQNIKED